MVATLCRVQGRRRYLVVGLRCGRGHRCRSRSLYGAQRHRRRVNGGGLHRRVRDRGGDRNVGHHRDDGADRGHRAELSLIAPTCPAGLAGILWPYRVVAVTAVLASLSSLCLGILWPLVTGLPWGLVFVLSAVPLVLLSWSLLGCIQVVNQVARHFSNNQRADEVAESVRRIRRSE